MDGSLVMQGAREGEPSGSSYSESWTICASEALREQGLPEEIVQRVTTYASPRLPVAVNTELMWCWATAAATRKRLLGQPSRDSFDVTTTFGVHVTQDPAPSAIAASVAAILLVRRGGRDVRLRGRRGARFYYFPGRRGRRRRQRVFEDSDDEDDGALRRHGCAIFRHAAVFMSAVLLLAPSIAIVTQPAVRTRTRSRVYDP